MGFLFSFFFFYYVHNPHRFLSLLVSFFEWTLTFSLKRATDRFPFFKIKFTIIFFFFNPLLLFLSKRLRIDFLFFVFFPFLKITFTITFFLFNPLLLSLSKGLPIDFLFFVFCFLTHSVSNYNFLTQFNINRDIEPYPNFNFLKQGQLNFRIVETAKIGQNTL